MSIEETDWRLTGHQQYLRGLKWERKVYTKYRADWDHDHCELCALKLTEPGPSPEAGVAHEGYSAERDRRWLCLTCFDDFKATFGWTVETSNG